MSEEVPLYTRHGKALPRLPVPVWWVVMGAACATLLLTAFLIGGIYQIAGGERVMYKLNRFTGTIWMCIGSSCEEMRTEKPGTRAERFRKGTP